MRHLDPLVDFELRERAIELREASAFYELFIHEVMSEPIEVDGVTYDLQCKADFVRHGLHGDIEINSIEFGNVYLYAHELGDSHILLNQESFKSRQRSTYDKIIRAVTALALKKASASSDWIMEDECEV